MPLPQACQFNRVFYYASQSLTAYKHALMQALSLIDADRLNMYGYSNYMLPDAKLHLRQPRVEPLDIEGRCAPVNCTLEYTLKTIYHLSFLRRSQHPSGFFMHTHTV